MLLRADILLLDEPTNHLDVANVRWLETYLTEKTAATCLIVSHDSGFLDNVCTHITHYHRHRLDVHKGNLSAFVAVWPPARSYYELDAAVSTMTFPQPGMLVGVTSRDRAILKLRDVAFQYPGAPTRQLENVDVSVCLSSRIAVVGANGAGKSTLIKMMTGETEPVAGTVWKHPNLRLAYVAQHAFHHVEQHLDSTPLQYLQWRYGTGEDREAVAKVTRQVGRGGAGLVCGRGVGRRGVGVWLTPRDTRAPASTHARGRARGPWAHARPVVTGMRAHSRTAPRSAATGCPPTPNRNTPPR